MLDAYDITRTQLAETLHIDRLATVSDWATGKRTPRAAYIWEVLAELHTHRPDKLATSPSPLATKPQG